MLKYLFPFSLGLLVLAAHPACADFGTAPLGEPGVHLAEPLESEIAEEPVSMAPPTTAAQAGGTPLTLAPAPTAYQPTAPAPSAPTVGKKWLQHESGYTIVVDADVTPGPGFREVSAPTVQAAPAWSAPAPSAPSPAAQPQQSFQSIPTTGYSSPAASPGAPSSGKKWMRHRSGYTVVVDANAVAGPDFVEIPPPAGSTAAAQPQTYQPAPSYQPAQAYSTQPSQPVPAQPQTFSSMPQTQSVGGQQPLPNLPPNYQRQLPYQPPTPQGVQLPPPPMRTASTFGGFPGSTGATPASPAVPPGKKYIVDQQGMRYLVSADAVVGAGFRELTPEEASQPTRIMVTPQMMQQIQQQGGSGGMPQQMMMQQGRGVPQQQMMARPGGMMGQGQQQMMMPQQQQRQAPSNPLSGMFNFLRR